jgi:uncharacterized peroxidase-related enzyme
MSLIHTTALEDATGRTRQLYRRLRNDSGYLPNYARIFGHRPALMTPLVALQDSIRSPLSERLYALVTLAAARATGSSYCSLAFARRLLRHMSQADLVQVLTAPAEAPITDGERTAMALAEQVARDASGVGQAHIASMRAAGFSDTDIFDVVVAAAWRCFFARIPDALGALPDRALGQLDPTLLELLLVGRPLETAGDPQHSVAQPAQAAHSRARTNR